MRIILKVSSSNEFLAACTKSPPGFAVSRGYDKEWCFLGARWSCHVAIGVRGELLFS
jgi:hypothetical protein